MNKNLEKKIIFLFAFIMSIYFLNNNGYKYIEVKTQNRFLPEKIEQNISIDNNYKKYDFENKIFEIVSRSDCNVCGLFSYYSVHLGCILVYLSQGYIPIIKTEENSDFYSPDMKSIKKNLWEELFNQPFNYTFNEVIKNSKHIEYK